MAAAAVDTTSHLSVLPASNADATPKDLNINDLAGRNYIRWDSKGVEVIPPNEDDDIAAVVEQINTIQKTHYDKHRHAFGGTHARTHGIIKGTFVVPDNLPKHLKQGELFSKGGEYPAVCRYSTEPGDPGMDVSSRLRHESSSIHQRIHF